MRTEMINREKIPNQHIYGEPKMKRNRNMVQSCDSLCLYSIEDLNLNC
jgi:hypothetical protein